MKLISALFLLLAILKSAPSALLAADYAKPGTYDVAQPITVAQRTQLSGAGSEETVLRFKPSVKGSLIQSAGFGGPIDTWFNSGNGKTCFCPSVRDIGIDGQAGLRTYPYNNSTDFVPRAAGISLQGTGSKIQHVRLFQIPGTAIVMRSGGGDQSGEFCAYDYATTIASGNQIINCYAGIDDSVGDSRLEHNYITGVVKDGITVSGAGTYLEDDHVWGADRALVVLAQIVGSNLYTEAARIGCEIDADECDIDGLNIGRGTCWERGVLIKSDSNSVRRVSGGVQATAAGQKPIAGVEIAAGKSSEKIEGRLNVGDGSIGVIVRGQHQEIDFRPGWIDGTQATAVKVDAPIFNSRITIRGSAQTGAVLDLSSSGLDKPSPNGWYANKFEIGWVGAATYVIYPGGGTVYNLAPGNIVELGGVVQK